MRKSFFKLSYWKLIVTECTGGSVLVDHQRNVHSHLRCFTVHTCLPASKICGFLLGCNCSERGIYDYNICSRLFDVSTYQLHMERKYTWWSLWELEGVLFVAWHPKSGTRFDRDYHAYASTLDSSSSLFQEGNSNRGFCNGLYVSIHILFQAQTDVERICAVTIGRIVETHNGRISHITQDYISVSLLTMLEPLLGTICCTLPLLRPVAQKIFAVCGRGSVLNSERHSSGPSVEMKRVQRRVVGPYSLGTMTDVPSENNSQINLHVLTDDHSACGLTELERVRIR